MGFNIGIRFTSGIPIFCKSYIDLNSTILRAKIAIFKIRSSIRAQIFAIRDYNLYINLSNIEETSTITLKFIKLTWFYETDSIFFEHLFLIIFKVIFIFLWYIGQYLRNLANIIADVWSLVWRNYSCLTWPGGKLWQEHCLSLSYLITLYNH